MNANPWVFSEWHHLYLGVVLIVVGLVVRRRWPRAWKWVAGVGAYLVLDDAAQHFLGWPSPAKWLYGQTLWRLAWVRDVNVWLDDLFAGRL
jgi:hypothetical protein